jgi:uncharacterized membrane protein YphA (DoxX/SURF4 family)
MNTIIWVIQSLVAAFFLMPAFTKLLSSKEKLVEKKILESDQSVTLPRIIGFLEFLGSIGIILPLLTGILPILTPLAATGLALIMLGAFAVHYQKKEFKMIPLIITLLVLCFVVAVYRF